MPLSPETQALMDSLATQEGKPLHEMSVEEARSLSADLAEWSGDAPQMARTDDVMLPVAGGEILVRVQVPAGTPRAVLLFIHGGGWVIGSVAESDGLCRRMAVGAGAIVVSVDYRMAPEHRFPVAVDDCIAALDWTAWQFPDLPLFVGGDSAGGNLATVVAAAARDKGGPALRGQVLIYPVADCDFTRPSYLAAENQQILTSEGMQWFWDHYLPDPALRRDPRASPLHADQAGLPPACVVIAGVDVLRDEVEALALAMEQAGVSVTRIMAEGLIHGYFGWSAVLPSGGVTVRQVTDWIAANS